jgi:fibronectin-binding autotransporter adhesin
VVYDLGIGGNGGINVTMAMPFATLELLPPIGSNPLGVRISGKNNTIGGKEAGAGNIISGNTGDGVSVSAGASGNTIGGLSGGGSNTIDFNGGDGVLVDGGDGSITTLGTNLSSQGTNIVSGTVQLGAINALPTGTTLTVSGTGTFDLNGFAQTVGGLADGGVSTGTVTDSGTAATFTINNTTANTYSGLITNGTNALSLTKTGTGTLTLSGASNSYTGVTTISAGTLKNGVANALPTGTILTVSGTGTFDLNGFAQTVSGLADGGANTGTVTDSGAAATFTINNTTANTYSGLISNGTNALSLTKTGTDTLTLSRASNSYTGVTTISGGILSVSTLANGGSNSGIGKSSNAAANLVLDGGTLQYTGAAVSSDRLFTLTRNGGTLDASGSGALTLSNTGTEACTSSGARTLTLTGNNSGTLAAVLGDGSGGATSLNKTGTGTWVVSGANNSYGGGTAVSAGTLKNGVTNALPTGTALTVSGTGTFDLNGFAQTVGGLADLGVSTGTVTDSGNAATLTVNNPTANTYSGLISNGTNALSLTKTGTGTLTLSGTNTYSGTTIISAGTLQIGNGGTSGTLGTGPVTDNSALTFNRTDSIPVSNTISGTGGLTQEGMGMGSRLTLSGENSYSGTTLITAGTLLVNGSQTASNVTVSSGAMLGGLGAVGGITFIAGSSFVVRLNGTTPGSGYDQLNATGAVDLSGNPMLTGTAGFQSVSGDSFTILLSGSGITGIFGGRANNATLPISGQFFQIQYTSKSVILITVAVGVPTTSSSTSEQPGTSNTTQTKSFVTSGVGVGLIGQAGSGVALSSGGSVIGQPSTTSGSALSSEPGRTPTGPSGSPGGPGSGSEITGQRIDTRPIESIPGFDPDLPDSRDIVSGVDLVGSLLIGVPRTDVVISDEDPILKEPSTDEKSIWPNFVIGLEDTIENRPVEALEKSTGDPRRPDVLESKTVGSIGPESEIPSLDVSSLFIREAAPVQSSAPSNLVRATLFLAGLLLSWPRKVQASPYSKFNRGCPAAIKEKL